jgi:hypothetical protein
VTGATISGGGGFFTFGTTSGCGGGTTCTFSQPFTVTAGTIDAPVRCQPAGTGTRTATVTFASDSDSTATTSAQLTCTAGRGAITTTPGSHDFGGVAQGSTRTLRFTLANTGNVTITGITGSLDPTSVGYAFNAASVAGTLAPGQTQSLDVTFAPRSGDAGGPATLTFNAVWSSTGTTSSALALDGDGLAASYDVTPAMAFDFGNFRFDTAPTRVYQIVNTGEVDLMILTQAFTPDAGTATAELGVTIRSGAAVVTLPRALAPGARLDVTLTALPNNRIGLVAGHLDIHSDLAINPDRRVTVTGNAITALLTAPPSAAFGAVDVDGPAPSQTIALANTGAAPLDITSITALAGASPAFAVVLPTGSTQVAPGDNLPLTITYTPTLERPPNQFDTAVLVASLAGIAGGPTQAMITLTGRGIDRHLVVDAVDPFPPAFRNPGSSAIPRAITVHNNGEAGLRISAVMLAGAPVWQLVDARPIDILGGGSHDFLVKFLPTTVGAAPEGQLTLFNNDNGKPMAVVRLTGNGKARGVSFGEAPIDLGYTGVGIPITAADILTVTNLDPRTRFTIHAISIDDPAFQVIDPPSDVELAALAAARFGVTFAPTAVGDFTATASLYLDEDREQTAEVRLAGHAVFVAAHGGGGCDVGGRGPGWGALLGLAILALTGSRWRRALAGASAIGGLVVAPPAAHADGIDLAVFEPTPATTGTGFQLQSPEVGADGSWVARTVLSYASNPLVVSAIDSAGRLINRGAVIRHSSALQLGAAYAFAGRFEVGAYLPLFVQRGDPAGDRATGFSTSPVTGSARGNLTLHAKLRLWRSGPVVVGASAMVVLPTATQDTFTGGDQPEGRVAALASYAPGERFTLVANAGGVLRGETTYANLAQQSGVAWGAGASYRMLDALWATAEVFGEATPAGERQLADAMPVHVLAPVEWLAGVSYQLERRVTIGLAAGRGVTSAAGTPDLRGVFSLAIIAGAAALRPIHPVEPPAPDFDTDRDGVVDRLDECPREPEDLDLFDDADGCPELDNDHDGIADALDRCPLDPEDKDGFQDADGCRDPDNDGDRIADAQDKCRDAPEDRDGFEDLDGCPEPDNDHDGLADAKDRCPTAPETINGIQDDDGCPDKGDSTIVLSVDRIATLDPIEFAGVKLTKATTVILVQVAATLRAHDEIVRVRVTSYVQPTDDSDADQARSDRRAQAICAWLIAAGIDKARLEPRGFGGEKPLVPATRRGAAKLNDRIELIILERK